MSQLTLLGFAAILQGAIRNMDTAAATQMEKAAVVIENEAKRVLGTYDYGWPQLSPVTLARKSGNTPGLETGGMRDSIEHVSSKDELTVGSNESKALWFELGTSTGQPPRPFLSGALTHKWDEINDILGEIPKIALQGGAGASSIP